MGWPEAIVKVSENLAVLGIAVGAGYLFYRMMKGVLW